ncbi:GNAT family N-acetyltransferase [Polynucleobacter paneuropaeus]|nr:GNAT family N-acetyltransferase [Polynucleobacter paneuropaeus]
MSIQLGKEYYVRAFQEEDLVGSYPSWFEDQDVCKYNSHGKFFKTPEYFQEFYKSLNFEDRVVWAVCHNQDGHIGNISLQSISLVNRNAEFAILLGDKRHWGKGVGGLAGAALISHGFRNLNLERIYCGTAETNKGMRKLATSLGMREEGRRRSHLYLSGEWVDMIEYGILRSDDFKK